jgi:L-threonylcarbamoyladenylate synthase
MKLEDKTEKKIVKEAVKTLADGGILIYPTETCYGIGVDATNQEAVDRLMKYKSRREGKPLSVVMKDMEMAEDYAVINELAQNLYENYLPGPLTVVSKGKGKVAKGVESEFGTLGIRIPDYKLILKIVEEFGKPFTATSANVSYKPRPYSIDKLLDDSPKKQAEMIDMIIDAGELPDNESSTVIDTTMNNLNVMREGARKFNEDIEDDKVLLKASTVGAEQTVEFGNLNMLKQIDEVLDRPVIFALKGELGAGKTQFAKGVAQQLGITEQISSPTYTIIDEYDYKVGEHREGKLIHMDTWRVDGSDELKRTGIENYFKVGNVIAIEWADKFYGEIIKLASQHGAKLLKVVFEYDGIDQREIKVYTESD